jgi:PAS domain S-box-containing protein
MEMLFKTAESGPIKVVLTYATLSAAWILFSDQAVAVLFEGVQQIAIVSTIKGWAFVVVTSAILYGLMRRMVGNLAAMHANFAKEQAEKLRALKLLEIVSEQSTDAIFVKDKGGRYLLFNRQAGRFVGKDSAAVIGLDDRSLFPIGEAEALMEFEHRLMEQDQTCTIEETVTTPRGITTFLSTKGPLYDDNHCQIGLFGISRDITERKRVEVELKAAKDAAERANSSKSRFFASAGHDLRQPFQAMRLSFEVLDGCASERQRPAMNLLGKAMASAETLLGELLDVARLESGLITVRPEDVDLGSLLADMKDQLEPMAKNKGLALRVRPCAAIVHTDPVLLRRVLFNLASNAIRYTERGGILIGVRHRPGKLLIEFWDSGIGIAPHHTETIFEDFFQVGNAARDRANGLGLGLAIVKRLTATLGCEVTVSSRVGKGSVFRLCIPILEVLQPPIVPPSFETCYPIDQER